MGGYVRLSDPPTLDILITGYATCLYVCMLCLCIYVSGCMYGCHFHLPLVCRHENGAVKFWDVTSAAMHQISEVKTGVIFGASDLDPTLGADTEGMFSEFSWPPYRKVGSYDPFSDDQRLAIKFIDFCPYTRKLCVGGAGGQVVTFALNPMPADVMVEVNSFSFSSTSSSSSSSSSYYYYYYYYYCYM